jgi:hypothetical protein
VRDDTGLPRWARAALPLILIGQYVAIGLHVGLGYAQRLRRQRERQGGRRPG